MDDLAPWFPPWQHGNQITPFKLPGHNHAGQLDHPNTGDGRAARSASIALVT